MSRFKLLTLGLLTCALPLLLRAAAPIGPSPGPAAPPPPALYNVRIRYQIVAFSTERLRQYNEMMAYLKKIGFQRDPEEEVPDSEPEDASATRLNGALSSGAVARLLRQRHVRTVLLVPEKAKLPDDKKEAVRVDLRILEGLLPEQQLRLHGQVAKVLASLGFVEAVGYDHRNHSRLLGTTPRESLETILEDLRKTPAGKKEPAPFQRTSAVRLIEARPDLPLPSSRPAPSAVPPGQEKLTPELREVLADADRAARPTRMEVILANAPGAEDATWAAVLAQPGLVIEGRLGQLVTVRGAPSPLATKLAALDEVVAVRLPRQARVASPGVLPRAGEFQPLKASGVLRLHAIKKRGKGIHLAVVADNFRGWEALKGRKLDGKALPDPVLVDMTRERNSSLLPGPFPPGEVAGPGTRYAQTILATAPEAKLTLVRIDPAAPYMLEAAARAINGETYRTFGIEQSLRKLTADRETMEDRRDAIIAKRKATLDDFRDTPDARAARKAYFQEQDDFDKDDKALGQRLRRYLEHVKQVKGLKGVNIVASTLVWSEGYPVDGGSALSRYFDDRPFGAATWFQAAGDTRGQAWTGPFRDVDKNGVMELNAPDTRLPPGGWTRELNFLGWEAGGKTGRDLPANARVRISLQWKEAHDPVPVRAGEDPYREPLNKLRLVLLHQFDPDGKARPADDLSVVAQSAGTPQRLVQAANFATYEQVIEFAVAKAGRYALRVEGKLADSIHLPGEARLPVGKKFTEVRPRLFVQTVAGDGRAVWTSYVSPAGSIGMPADARRVITVGAADRDGSAQPFSAPGPPYNLALLQKPDVLSYDDDQGTGQATAFAAGLSACLRTLKVQPGKLMRLPKERR